MWASSSDCFSMIEEVVLGLPFSVHVNEFREEVKFNASLWVSVTKSFCNYALVPILLDGGLFCHFVVLLLNSRYSCTTYR